MNSFDIIIRNAACSKLDSIFNPLEAVVPAVVAAVVATAVTEPEPLTEID